MRFPGRLIAERKALEVGAIRPANNDPWVGVTVVAGVILHEGQTVAVRCPGGRESEHPLPMRDTPPPAELMSAISSSP